MNKKSKIYIAGHAGLVGSAIVRRLRAGGYTGLICKTHAELELLDQKAVQGFFAKEKPEYVIVAAAKVGGIKANMAHQADFLYENLEIQNNIIWAAHKADVKKLVFLASSCCYPRESPQPMKEEYVLDGKPEPTNEGYAIAKIAGVKLCEKISEQYGQTFVSCMPSNIYGPGDSLDPDHSHVISALFRRMHEAKEKGLNEVVCWGTGKPRREFLFVDDLADAVVWMLESYADKQFVNIGTGEDVSIKEFAELVKKIVGYKGKIVFDTTKPDGMMRKLMDVSLASSKGWKSKTKLEDGLKLFYEWFKEQKL